MFLFKKLVGAFADPLMLAAVLGLIALMLVIRRKRSAAARVLVAALVLIYVCSIPPVSEALLHPLERPYPPLTDARIPSGIQYVVVLGSGYTPRDDIPVTAALDGDGLRRVVEGVRLFRKSGGTHLVLSGGAYRRTTSPAEGYALLAKSLGVPESALMLISEPLDTAAEAKAISTSIGSTPCILVTSAYHMRRAMRLMERAGVHAIPAPTGQQLSGNNYLSLQAWLPASGSMRAIQNALHEYLGLAAMALGLS